MPSFHKVAGFADGALETFDQKIKPQANTKIKASVNANTGRWMIKLTRIWKIRMAFSASHCLTREPIAVCLQGSEGRTVFFLGMETLLLLEGTGAHQPLRSTIPYYCLAYHRASSTMNISPSGTEDQFSAGILAGIASSFRTGHAMANTIPAGW